MAEITKAFEHSVDQRGRFFFGYAAILDSCGRTVALVCPTMGDLHWVWERLDDSVDLDVSAVQRVRIHKDK